MDSAQRLQAGIALETLLLTPVLQPLCSQRGGFGEFGAALLAAAVARSDAGMLARQLAARLNA